MKTQREKDLKLYAKAKHRVNFVLGVVFLALCLLPLAAYFLISQPLFERPPHFDAVYIGALIAETVVWAVIFFTLSNANKTSRKYFWAAVGAECVFAVWLIYDGITHPAQVWVYIVWVMFLAFKIILLMFVGNWLQSGWWPRIYLDRVLLMSKADMEKEQQRKAKAARLRQQETERRKKAAAASQQAKPADAASIAPIAQTDKPQQVQNRPKTRLEELDEERAKKQESPRKIDFVSSPADQKKITAESSEKLASWKKAAVRIGICIYGELIAFPMIVHIFDGAFVSLDNSSIFALSLMFTLCILTAVLWTIPLFYMYLEQPGAKKSVYFGCAGQLLILAYGIFMLYEYGHSETITYSTMVFVKFIGLEIVRYFLMFRTIAPVFKLDEIPPESYFADEDDEEPEKGQEPAK